MCSKQAGNYFLVYPATFVNTKRVFKSKKRLLFSLFSHVCNTKLVCSKQARGCCFSLLVTLVIRNMCVQSEREVALVIRKMNVSVFLVFVLSYKYSYKTQVTKRLFSLVDEKCV